MYDFCDLMLSAFLGYFVGSLIVIVFNVRGRSDD